MLYYSHQRRSRILENLKTSHAVINSASKPLPRHSSDKVIKSSQSIHSNLSRNDRYSQKLQNSKQMLKRTLEDHPGKYYNDNRNQYNTLGLKPQLNNNPVSRSYHSIDTSKRALNMNVYS